MFEFARKYIKQDAHQAKSESPWPLTSVCRVKSESPLAKAARAVGKTATIFDLTNVTELVQANLDLKKAESYKTQEVASLTASVNKYVAEIKRLKRVADDAHDERLDAIKESSSQYQANLGLKKQHAAKCDLYVDAVERIHSLSQQYRDLKIGSEKNREVSMAESVALGGTIAKQAHDLMRLRQENEELDALNAEQADALDERGNEIDDLLNDASLKDGRIEELVEEATDAEERFQDLKDSEEDYDAVCVAYDQACEEVREYRRDIEALTGKFDAAKKVCADQGHRNRDLRDEQVGLRSDVAQLEDLLDLRNQAVSDLLNAREQHEDVIAGMIRDQDSLLQANRALTSDRDHHIHRLDAQMERADELHDELVEVKLALSEAASWEDFDNVQDALTESRKREDDLKWYIKNVWRENTDDPAADRIAFLENRLSEANDLLDQRLSRITDLTAEAYSAQGRHDDEPMSHWGPL